MFHIQVEGVLGDAFLSRFPTLLVERGAARTVLAGDLPDQAGLLGALVALDTLGITILSVVRDPLASELLRGQDALPGQDPAG